MSEVPKRIRNKERTIALLVTATKDQLIDRGFHGISIQVILDAAQIKRGALFHHFPTKDHLIAAAFSELLDDLLEELNGVARKLRLGQATKKEFSQEISLIVSKGHFHGCMEVALAMRTAFELSELIKGAVEDWRSGFHDFWADTFELPGATEDEADMHWSLASDVLRGHAFSMSFGVDPVAHRSHIEGFTKVFLDSADVKPLENTITTLKPKTPRRKN